MFFKIRCDNNVGWEPDDVTLTCVKLAGTGYGRSVYFYSNAHTLLVQDISRTVALFVEQFVEKLVTLTET